MCNSQETKKNIPNILVVYHQLDEIGLSLPQHKI